MTALVSLLKMAAATMQEQDIRLFATAVAATQRVQAAWSQNGSGGSTNSTEKIAIESPQEAVEH